MTCLLLIHVAAHLLQLSQKVHWNEIGNMSNIKYQSNVYLYERL